MIARNRKRVNARNRKQPSRPKSECCKAAKRERCDRLLQRMLSPTCSPEQPLRVSTAQPLRVSTAQAKE
eukprot:2347743-Rhodomonas_salina.1